MIDASQIRKSFSNLLDRIDDKSLADAVVECFRLACEKGGWSDIEELWKIPFTLLTDTRGVSFMEHTIAVTQGALALGQAQIDNYKKVPYKIDMDRLVAGGILHDVGKLLEFEPDGKGGYRKSRHGKLQRHPISGAILAAQAGLSDEIVNMVACHAKEGDGRPKVLETVLVHQADFATFDPLVMLEKGLLVE